MLALRASDDRPVSKPVDSAARELQLERRAKVLCATYALSRSDPAVRRAHAIAHGLDAQLLILHVIDSL